MSVLKSYYNLSIVEGNISDDYLLVKKVGTNGEITVVPEKMDYSKIQKENGSVKNWSFDAMVKAGIDPKSLTPHTSVPRGLEGYDCVEDLLNDLKSIDTKTNTK